jgi:hypothetical protein
LPSEDRLKAIQIYSTPEKRDPLAFSVGEALIHTATVKGVSLVACIPDQAVWIKDYRNARSFLAEYEESSVIDEKDGWLLARPLSLERTRIVRLDRKSLKNLMTQTAAAGTIPLRARASLALENPLGLANGILVSMSRSILPGMFGKSFLASNTPWTTLRFFGALSKDQQTAALQGARFPLRSLPPKAHEVLQEIAFSTDSQVSRGEGAANTQSETDLLSVMTRRSRVSMSGQEIEPTEAFGAGFAPGAFVQIGQFNTPVFQAGVAERSLLDSFGNSGLDDLAVYLEISEATQGTQAGSGFARMDEVRVGQRSELKFIFQLRSDMYVEKSLLDDSFGAQTQTMAISNLPPAILDALKAKREQFKLLGTVMRMLSNGEGGIQIIPPSP